MYAEVGCIKRFFYGSLIEIIGMYVYIVDFVLTAQFFIIKVKFK